MNTAALKTFAPEVRRQLIEAVGRKLDYVLTCDSADLRAAGPQVAKLRAMATTSRSGLIERVAYTWFNRLAALRFLDARSWHPFGARVLTPCAADEMQPEILKLVRTAALPSELLRFTNPGRLNRLLDGELPSTDPQGEVYRSLILAVCRYYHDLMPFLFEALDDETELLLPDDLLTAHSIAHGFRTQIADSDCAEVEILGWLYQFYISEKKDQVMARKSAVPTEDIPSVTQLFTPHWIVRYLVENSLGRLWLRSRPNSRLREHMPYYLDSPDGLPPADCLTVARAEDIRFLDPASGSGHMLTYAFDLLYRIYEEEGHVQSEIPALILRCNLYGLEICPRATQLAQFALVCKAREKARSAFRLAIQPQVMCLEDVDITESEMAPYLRLPGVREVFSERVTKQTHQFCNTSNFGSLLQPLLATDEIQSVRSSLSGLSSVVGNSDFLIGLTHRKVLRALDQAEMLSQRYHVVVANPPYMGSKGMNAELKSFVKEHYPAGKADLFAAFMLRNLAFVLERGIVGMITIPSWLTLGSFEALRKFILTECGILSLVQNGRGVWGSDFGSCEFLLLKSSFDGIGVFKRLFVEQGEVNSNEQLEKAFFETASFPNRNIAALKFLEIAGVPICFWLSDIEIRCLKDGKNFADNRNVEVGLQTSNNDRFLRIWFEVDLKRFGLPESFGREGFDEKKWFALEKGGDFRKWAGNCEHVVNWQEKGAEIKEFVATQYPYLNGNVDYVVKDRGFFFLPGVSWGKISISRFSARANGSGYIFSDAGMKVVCNSIVEAQLICQFLNSKVSVRLLSAFSQTINFEKGSIEKLPFPDFAKLGTPDSSLFDLARDDWNNFETSWDFSLSPLLKAETKGVTLAKSWGNWADACRENIARMQKLETENNQIWINAYGLKNEITPEVTEEEITLARPDRRRDVAAFISYAIGCMMGRYSLDRPGLILADAGCSLEEYLEKIERPSDRLTFEPDADGVIPILDGEWFEDDIVARTREFLRAIFGDSTLAANISFIEESVGKNLRKYFLTDFYKDHLQAYKKRPIYWLFQSPKKGFAVLVYMHRYTRDTVNVVLNRYLREYQQKLRSRLEHLDRALASESTPTRDKTKARKESDQFKKVLRECEEWERNVLLPLAQQRIELNLDDGVKVNYLKLGDALAPIAGLAAKEDD